MNSRNPVLISIIVPCRNEARHLRAFLDSLLLQNAAEMELEILIADGMSTDGTREILAEYQQSGPGIRVIDNAAGYVSTGLNLAIRAACGEIIIRMDAHTEYSPDYVQTCVAVLLETGAANVGGPARTKAEGRMGRAIAAAYHSPFSTGGARFHDVAYEGPVDTVTYGCWRKSTLEQAGLFDEALVRNQDDELNLRLVRAGGVIWQSPRIVSWYRPRAAISSLVKQYFQYGFWKVAVIRKHRIPASWRHLVPGVMVLGVIALCCAVAAGTATASPLLMKWSLRALAAILSIYLIGVLYASCRTALRYGVELFPILPGVFAAYHLSYGCGFLIGLFRGYTSTPQMPPPGAFTSLTR